ncbi:MAG: hypothetical protein WC683_01220 [bacterium]
MTGDTVLQLPVRLVREIANIPERTPEVRDAMEFTDPLLQAAMPWAVLYRHEAMEQLQVAGFETKDALGEKVAELYRHAEIVAVLREGRPRKFDMRVKARIG